MSDLRKAAQQALEAMDWHYRQGHSNTLGGFRLKIDEKAIRALRAALAQPEPAAPPRTALTDEQIDDCLPLGMAPYSTLVGRDKIRRFARAIEAALAGKAVTP